MSHGHLTCQNLILYHTHEEEQDFNALLESIKHDQLE